MNKNNFLFFTGWHQPNCGESGTKHFEYCLISVNRLLKRRSNFTVQNWILDSGAFSRLSSGKGHLSVKKYAKIINRWQTCGDLMAAVSQDYLCVPPVFKTTKLSVAEHQKLTIQRYDRLLAELKKPHPYIMPVLQGVNPQDYVTHLQAYADRIAPNAWVGVGSVCKKNSEPELVKEILVAIKSARPDLRLHGFGLKLNSLYRGSIRNNLYSADSQTHNFTRGKSKKFAPANNPYAALKYREDVLSCYQLELF